MRSSICCHVLPYTAGHCWIFKVICANTSLLITAWMYALAISNKYRVNNCLAVFYSTQRYVKCFCHTQKSGLSFSEDFTPSRMRHKKDTKWLATWDQFVWASCIPPPSLPVGSGMQLVEVFIICLPQSKCGCLAGYSSQGPLTALRCFLALALKWSGVTHFEA